MGGVCLCYIKTLNTVKRARVTAEDKALNARRPEHVCALHNLYYGKPILVTVFCQIEIKNNFIPIYEPFLCERQQAHCAS